MKSYESPKKQDNQSPTKPKETSSQAADFSNEFIKIFINKNENISDQKIIEYLENTNKNLQRCSSKPESLKEFLKDEILLEFVKIDIINHSKLLIKFFTKKINELKSQANSNFSLTKISNLSENSLTNYILVENFSENEKNINLNFVYFIIVSPSKSKIDFLTIGEELKLSFNHCNNLSDDSRTSWLKEIFETNLEDFIEDREIDNKIHLVLNLKKLTENILNWKDFKNLEKINTQSKMEKIEEFKINIKILSTNFSEEVKSHFIENEYHNNFIMTNNSKFMKKMFESQHNFYCYSNQMKEIK